MGGAFCCITIEEPMSENPTSEQAQTAGEAGSRTNASSTGQPPDAVSTGKTFTQAELDHLIKNRLAEQKRKLDEDAKAAKAKEQGEWQALAQQHETRVQELEPQIDHLTAERDERDRLIEHLIKDRVTALPDELRELLPKDAPISQRVTALIGFEKAAAKLAGQRTPGTPSGPATLSGATGTTVGADLLARKRASGDYAL